MDFGFAARVATPCNFLHEEKELFVIVHGDDFNVVGPDKALKWLKMRMEAIYEIKAEFLGPKGEDCQTEIRVFNRTIRWTDAGLEYEPDQRHAELIIEQMGMANCKPVSTPTCAEAEYNENFWLES